MAGRMHKMRRDAAQPGIGSKHDIHAFVGNTDDAVRIDYTEMRQKAYPQIRDVYFCMRNAEPQRNARRYIGILMRKKDRVDFIDRYKTAYGRYDARKKMHSARIEHPYRGR